jgi:hypothetical protein
VKNWTFRRTKDFGDITAKQWNFVINGVSLLVIWDSTNKPDYLWEVETLKAIGNESVFVKGYGKTRAEAFKNYKQNLKAFKQKAARERAQNNKE